MNKTNRTTLCGAGVVLCLLVGPTPLLLAQQTSPPPPGRSGDARRLTLSDAIALTMQNNREVRLAAAAVSRAEAERQEIRSQFRPQIFVGTGLAGTRGFPLSIEGSAPSIFQVASSQALFNASLRNSERQAGKMRDASERSLEQTLDDTVAATVVTYFDLDRARRSLESVRGRNENFLAVEQIVEERVRAGLDPPLETTRARLNTARSRSEQVALETQATVLEIRLRGFTGIPQTDAIVTAPAEIPPARADETVDRLISLALERRPGLQALEEEVRAKQFQVRSEEATRWPRINLVSQYGLFSNINNFSDYFRKFARHNAMLGVSIMVPIYERERRAARLSKAEAELLEATYRFEQGQDNIAQRVRELWAEAQQQGAAREVARLELEFARRSVEAALARFEEGRANRLAVEQARVEESRAWVNWFQAQYRAEAARVELLRVTGEIRAVFR